MATDPRARSATFRESAAIAAPRNDEEPTTDDRREPVLTTLEGWRKPASQAEEGRLADCSLVIATYKRSVEVCALLRRVQELPDAPAEVVVVDGSPDDATRRAVADWAHTADLRYQLVYVRSPAGLTRQRNVGIDASSGAIVFFLDDDCHPEPGYFRAIHQLYAEDTSGSVGAICGSPVNDMGKRLSFRWRLRLALGISPAGEAGEYMRMGASIPIGSARPFSGARPVAAMPGCTMSFRRAALARHRFSHFFYGYSQGEDLEMSLRVGRDYRVLWCGDAHAIHDHALGGRPASMEKGRMEVRNRYFIWKRHVSDAGVLDRIRFWSDTAYSIAYDLASFATRPTSVAPLRHMAGCLRGALGCIVAPPRHDEPAARREYDFDIQPLPAPAGELAGAGATRTASTVAGEAATPTHDHR
ncbi:MAG TPA: glycosyltransferase [Gemmatimonadaceae bacterium]